MAANVRACLGAPGQGRAERPLRPDLRLCGATSSTLRLTECAEREGLLGVGGHTGGPAVNRSPATDELEWRDLDRLGRGTDDEQLAIDGEPVDHGCHRLGAGDRRQDDAGAASGGKVAGDVI
jgi:hypothetical protein